MECLNTPVFKPDASVQFPLSSMGDAESSKSMVNLSLDISTRRFSRDLLQRFMGSPKDHEADKGEDEDDVELNLGLSLGGRFGVDKTSKTLVRSSSIASCLPTVRDDADVAAAPPQPQLPLVRTSSLPVETEEEWKKRKEMQTLRRMEAKRRRSEKQRNLRIDKESGGGSLSMEERKEIELNLREKLDREKTMSALRRSSSSLRSQLRLSEWTDPGKGKASNTGTTGGIHRLRSQGSIESKGGSSSSVSDLESLPMAGSSGDLSTASIQSFQESGSNEATNKVREQTSKVGVSDRGREVGANSMEDMPCVFTKGDGPNGRRVDGILYKYGKGEEVRIMCICHGTFHSPAEFIVHAGGTDVDNPLKHIVVNPNSASLM